MIANKIRLVRILKGLSQEFTADKLGVTQSAYSKIESGNIKVSFDKLQIIAEVFQCSTSYLINYGESDAIIDRINALEAQIKTLQTIVSQQQQIIATLQLKNVNILQ